MIHHAFTHDSWRQGVRKFPTVAKHATTAEMKQYHDMNKVQLVV
jgi:hypothetical protein